MMQVLLVGEQRGGGNKGSNDGLVFNMRSVVGAAAVFIVCQRSPAPVRDQGESNLVL
jgi:hypothetical protein